MRQHLFTILILILIISCNEPKNNGNSSLEPIADTIIVNLLPNRVVKTEQFTNGDSLKSKIAKEEYFNGSLIVKEVYRNYMTSEYDGFGDGEYQYFYNKEKKLIHEFYIESPSGDTVKSIYKYFKNSKDCHIYVYDFRRRLRSDMPHTDIIQEKDLTEKRIWLFNTMYINSYDKNDNLIRHYEPPKEFYYTNQNLYTYRYKGNKLIEEDSYLNDSILYWTEKYVYKKNEIIMTHDNLKRDKEDKWLLPFYIEITKLDNKGNAVNIEKYDNKEVLMRRYINAYDNKNRLVKMECFNEKNDLKLSHKLYYEAVQ
jgi:hypothetical protein